MKRQCGQRGWAGLWGWDSLPVRPSSLSGAAAQFPVTLAGSGVSAPVVCSCWPRAGEPQAAGQGRGAWGLPKLQERTLHKGGCAFIAVLAPEVGEGDPNPSPPALLPALVALAAPSAALLPVPSS